MNTPSSQHHVTNPAYTWSELLLFLEELITKDEKDRPFHQPPSILLFSDPFQPHTEQDLLQNKCMQALGANENFHFSQLSSPDATSIHPSLPSPSSPPVLSLHPRQSQKIIKKHSVNPATSYSSAVSGRKKTFVCPYEDCGKIFERRYNLKVHTRRHTGEMPYTCPKPECYVLQFRWRSSLRHHMKSVHNEVLPISQNSNAISKHKSMPDISNQSISPLRTPALSPTLFRQHALPDLNSMRVAPLLPSHPDRAQSQGGQHAEVPWWAVCDGPFLGQRGSHGGFIAGKSMCNGVSDVTEDELKVDVEPNFQCNRYNLKDNMGRTSNIGGEIASENSQNSVVQFEALRESMSGWPICRDLYSSY